MKNKFQSSVLIVLVSIFGFAAFANAQEQRQGGPKLQMMQMISIEPNGHAVVRGSLVSAAATSITVKAWGVNFTVDTSKAKIFRVATTTSPFIAGDFIDVSGRMDAANTGTVIAGNVRDVTAEQRSRELRKNERMGTSTPERRDNRDNREGTSSSERGDNRGRGQQEGQQGQQQENRGGMMNFFKDLFRR